MDLVTQLNRIFYPRAVAVVGASTNPEKLGYMCVEDILEAGYQGRVYPVNPGLTEAFGLKAYSSISAVPGEIDLAMVVIPSQLALPVIEECIAKGVKGVILVTSGFKEVGTETGLELQDKLKDIARRGEIRLIGPNTLGLINPALGLNATFQTTLSLCKSGSVAIAAQSGGMFIFIAHALADFNVGISKAIGLGNRCDLDFHDVLTYFARDDETKVVILYMEGLEQPRKLMKVAREVVKRKPVLVYKGGSGGEGDRATFSHTGALAGKIELYQAAYKQSGMIAAESITELIDMAKALNMQPPARGDKVAVLSGQAGPGIVIADSCRRYGLKLVGLSPDTKKKLRELASPLNAVDNPVDVAWRTSDFDACREMMKVTLDDEDVDGMIVAAVAFPPGVAVMRAVMDVAGYKNKPVTVCTDSPLGASYAEIHLLEEKSIPVYPLPERAATGMAGLVRYGQVLKRFSD